MTVSAVALEDHAYAGLTKKFAWPLHQLLNTVANLGGTWPKVRES